MQHASLMINGQARTYRLFRPGSLDPNQPAPLVVLLHGCQADSSGDQIAAVTHFDNDATTGRFVAVYPDAIGGCWNLVRNPAEADDLAFMNGLLDRLVRDLPISKTRIFVAGMQGGGHMAYEVACEVSSRIAAVASVSGGMPLDGCQPARPVSIMEMHGTDDSFLPYEGGGRLGSPSIVELIQRWRTLDGCLGDPILSQSGITKTSLWNECKSGTVVRLDTVVGGHNTWFGSHSNPVPGEPNANSVIWSFFSSLQPRG